MEPRPKSLRWVSERKLKLALFK